MAISIREYLGYEGFQVEWNHQKQCGNLNMIESEIKNAFYGVSESVSPDSLMVDIEGIHVGPTRNYTWYTEEALQGSINTWTRPYLRPLIMHHNEKDGKIIGRVKFATYTDKNTRSNTGALLFTCNVPDKEGKEQIQDGRLKTVSIGVIVHDCRCSICGQNIAEDGECDHERGVKYDGKTCYWMIYSMEAKELSYVIVPSDIYAHNIRVYKPTKADMNVAANFENKGVLNVSEATVPVTESKIVDENGDKDITITPAPDTTILEKEIADLKAKAADLQTKVDGLEKEKADAIEDAQKAREELDSTKVLLTQVQKSVETVKDQLTAKESELGKEISLRESLENQMIQFNTDSKNNLIENVMLLRSTLGKPVVLKESLDARSEDSLRDAIKDLKEELAGPIDVTRIATATNPGMVENKENKSNVEKEKKTGNIDLAEGLENVFAAIVGSKNKTY